MVMACPMFFKSFPMDSQKCHLLMTTLTSGNLTLELRWFHEREEHERVDIDDLYITRIEPLKYKLVNATTDKYFVHWPAVTFISLRANLTFVRYLSSHLFNVYVPSTLVVVLSFLSFWLNVRSVPARVALGLTSLLTLSTQASQARAHLPPVNYLTALDVWLFACILFVFLSLIEYATVYHCYNAKINNKASSSAPKTWANVSHGSRADVRIPKFKRTPSAIKKPAGSDFDEDTQFLDKACRFIFPFSFIVFSSTYWICYLKKQE